MRFLVRDNLNFEWQMWVRENLEKGCTADEVSKILEEAGFAENEFSERLHYELKLFRKLNDMDRSEEILSSASSTVDRLVSGTRGFSGAVRASTNLVELHSVENFLSQSECQHLIDLVKSQLRPSTITNSDEPDKQFRTSSTCDLSRIDDTVRLVDSRICEYLGIEQEFSEPMQGQHYVVGQEFKPHCDYFSPEDFDKGFGKSGQRTWTVMIYLNENLLGGSTRFVNINQDYEPRTGRALVWNNLYPDGEPNPYTSHHGMPIELGEKTVLTKWFRVKPYLDT